MGGKKKKIMQLDSNGKLIATFKSIRDAERKTGIKNQTISRCALGGPKAGGFKWKYVDE